MRTRLAFGFGGVAFGVKETGLKYFLLLFYSQVIGLDPRLVSLAILIALIADAFSDPIVGYWSDNFRSRWGRRHPFMYAAALPPGRATAAVNPSNRMLRHFFQAHIAGAHFSL